VGLVETQQGQSGERFFLLFAGYAGNKETKKLINKTKKRKEKILCE
jgi:hypothetical protein